MADADRDKMLREMAANRGCRLVKSRRRTPGVGDYGRYGLKDAGSGKEVFGFGADGLVATADEIESFLRKALVSDWKSSLAEQAAGPAPEPRKPPSPTPSRPPGRDAAPPRPRPGTPPRLRVVEAADPPPARKPPPPQPSPPPPPPAPSRPVLVIRDARPADAEGLAALLAVEARTVKARIAALRKADEPPLLAEECRKIVGCAAWHALPSLTGPAPLGRITFLLVESDHRRRGIGRALVEAVEARLAAAGCRRAEALAEIELAAAPDFFRRLGWTRSAYRYARDLAADRAPPDRS